MADKERFVKIYSQSLTSERKMTDIITGRESGDIIEIWVDTETGVHYMLRPNSNGNFTPVLNRDGKPVATPPKNNK